MMLFKLQLFSFTAFLVLFIGIFPQYSFSQSQYYDDCTALPDKSISIEMDAQKAKVENESLSVPKKFTSDEFINFGHSVWKIFNGNRPEINYSQNRLHVLPRAARCWTDMEEWQVPVTYELPLVLHSKILHRKLVDAVFSVTYSFGGHMNGKGQYITGLTVLPSKVEIKRKYAFDATAKIIAITNAGTREDPIARVELRIHWSLEKIKRKKNKQLQHGFMSLLLQGDGLIQRLQ